MKFPTSSTTQIEITVARKAGEVQEQSQKLYLYISGSLKEEKVEY